MKFTSCDNNMTYQDEFDVYFARAKLDEEMAREKQEDEQTGNNRRGSLPGQAVIHLDVQPHHRRALSCKLPSRKKSRKGSKSPRESTPPSGSGTPTNTPLIDIGNMDTDNRDDEPEMQGISMNYITEATLRAPSPRFDGGGGNGGSSGGTFKCHSAPHSRSSSWKNKKRPRSFKQVRNGENESPESKSRQGSVTQFEEEVTQKLEQLKLLQAEDVCVVRNFSTSSKGLINRGDSFKRKPRNSTTSNTSDGEPRSGIISPVKVVSTTPATITRARNISVGSCNTESSMDTPSIHRVLVIGDRGVGKTALLQQFMTSQYMGAAETSFDDDCEKTVTVLLDGEETMIDFIEVAVESDLSQYGEVDGYLLCFSITSKPSFHYMKDVLEGIIKSTDRHQAIIVVANKSDLVRKRQVSENDARIVCIRTDCKYVEVSAGINHKVDDLLVGITTQIRLNPTRIEHRKNAQDGPQNISCASAKGLMQLLFKRNHQTSKSCDNLLVL